MDKVAGLTQAQRHELFTETAALRGMTTAIVEKDFWVTWTLDKLFAHAELSRILMFKGGTSLSKVFGLIERFSEDIDLILNWRVVTGEDLLNERSKSKQDKLNKAIDAQGQQYIADELHAMVSEVVAPLCTCKVAMDDPNVLNVQYPAAFSDEYLRPEIRLEVGPLASWLPFDQYIIQPYAAETFPHIFDRPTCQVNAIKAERTFWEKATILHHEANRPQGNQQPPRYSRHYYDLAKMAASDVKNAALADLELLEAVVAFKIRFYPRGWAQYDLAKPGTLRLVPKGHVLDSVKADYGDMAAMIYGDYLHIDDVLGQLQILENEINDIG